MNAKVLNLVPRHACTWQDVKALTALARKRCSDEKAGVRKAAAQLLEGLLLLHASGAGGAPVVLPSPPDVAVVQAAAADSLASPGFITYFCMHQPPCPCVSFCCPHSAKLFLICLSYFIICVELHSAQRMSMP